MAIEKRFIHFKRFSDFNSKKLSANEANTQYTVGVSGAIQNGDPDILYQSYVWIKDTKQQWTHGQLYDGTNLNEAGFLAGEETSDQLDDVETHTYVKYVPQTLTDEQKAQTRINIDAISGSSLKTINGESIVGVGDITISGGSSSGGSGAYSEVNHGTNDTTFTLTPNTFHVWDEVASLTLDFGSETSGVANEFLFQFTSGATATSLTLPDDIKWANELTIEPNMIYQVSILKGLGSVMSWTVTVLIDFTIGSTEYQAEQGMTWLEWTNSKYNINRYKYHTSGKIVSASERSAIADIAANDIIIPNNNYTIVSFGGSGGAD